MNPAVREHAASDDHVVKCTKFGQHLPIFIHFAKSRVLITSSCPLLSAPILTFKSPTNIVMSFSFSLSHNVCSLL